MSPSLVTHATDASVLPVLSSTTTTVHPVSIPVNNPLLSIEPTEESATE